MSMPLFLSLVKKNWVLLLIFFAVLTMYQTVMIAMFDPENIDAITAMLNLFPEEMLRAFGFSEAVTDLTGYLASWLYGMLMLAFPLVFSIILGTGLIAKKVDNGSMAYILSTPISRIAVAVTSGAFAIVSMLVLFVLVFLVGIAASAVMLPGLLDIGAYFRLNVTTFLVNTAVLMIVFFFSCLFSENQYALGFGAGIPILFLLFNMLGGVSEQAQILKTLSLYGWYDPVDLVRGNVGSWLNFVYLGLALLLFDGGIFIFHRKQLPL